MGKTEKRAAGDLGEEVAVKWLTRRGFVVVDRNFWKPWGEIDIVAKRSNPDASVGVKYYFVEVKTRKQYHDENYSPADNMTPDKIVKLNKVIQTYLSENKIDEDTDWQIDLAMVRLGDYGEGEVEMLEDVG